MNMASILTGPWEEIEWRWPERKRRERKEERGPRKSELRKTERIHG